ncbi:hypothetical protein Patl1_25379 [Pistacia atlantica]|uniref:Uncharacterized protein n=1 Tax=Pistacia atlantica TaxID=434234 RepID=A0ACC1B450_9ROSI|nr:hypothetical protein Patl1_25379 [Pistacia atlantica]
MGKKELQDQKANERVEAVLKLLRKQAPLTVKQEKFCTTACVARFLRAKGDSVKKSAKHLRACLSWRGNIGIDNLTADEFSAELVEGVAYVAGNDEESRPVLVFRIKQDYQKFHSQKMFTRLLVFTLEVAIGTMSKSAEQLVILFDATAACKLRDQARNFVGEQTEVPEMIKQCPECPLDVKVIAHYCLIGSVVQGSEPETSLNFLILTHKPSGFSVVALPEVYLLTLFFQISFSFSELIADNAEDFGGLLSGKALQGLCHRPTFSFFLSMEGCPSLCGAVNGHDGGSIARL